MFKYFPQTDEDVRLMLEKVQAKTLDDLYSDIPEAVRFREDYRLPAAMTEMEIRDFFGRLAAAQPALTSFAGAGCYDHYAPSIVQSFISRSEFLTSYTPYQAEISQGTLHYIFEYQSMMTELTGLDISNASMYDGATATAEAVMMAFHAMKKAEKVLIAGTLDPKVRRVVDTYAHFNGIDLVTVPSIDGVLDREFISAEIAKGGVAGVVVQTPNYYGIIEDLTGLADEIHAAKGLLVINSHAADLALLKTPGEWGADIAVGEAQSLGIPMNYGGPGLGYMCCTEKLVRKLPGRIVGMTKDNRGQRAFVLTLQAREQHIRRQKATSNICSNQSLMALYVTIYLSVMGKQGLKEAAELSYAGAHWLADKICENGGKMTFPGKPFFNEFCITTARPVDEIIEAAAKEGILAGVKIDDHTLMLAVTEKRTKKEMEILTNIINGKEGSNEQ